MGRPLKEGLDYFFFDVNFFNDDTVRVISAKHGPLAKLVMIQLLTKIYGDHGYYYPWTEKEKLLLASDLGMNWETVEAIVLDCVQWGFFDKRLFELEGILTSLDIQKKFQAATSKRTTNSINERFSLLKIVSASETVLSATETLVSDAVSTQSRVEKSRVEKSRVEKSKVNNNPLNPPSKGGGFCDEPEILIFPPKLDTSECREAWDDWIRYKKSIKKPYKTIKSEEAQLRRWEDNPEMFLKSVEYSIAQGYSGIFPAPEPRANGHGSYQNQELTPIQRERLRLEKELAEAEKSNESTRYG